MAPEEGGISAERTFVVNYVQELLAAGTGEQRVAASLGVGRNTVRRLGGRLGGRVSESVVQAIHENLFRVSRDVRASGLTVADEATFFTPESLSALVPPRGAQRFKLVTGATEQSGGETGFAQTDFFNVEDDSPAVVAEGMDVDVHRVIWFLG